MDANGREARQFCRTGFDGAILQAWSRRAFVPVVSVTAARSASDFLTPLGNVRRCRSVLICSDSALESA
jgi:hypothetical protein